MIQPAPRDYVGHLAHNDRSLLVACFISVFPVRFPPYTRFSLRHTFLLCDSVHHFLNICEII